MMKAKKRKILLTLFAVALIWICLLMTVALAEDSTATGTLSVANGGYLTVTYSYTSGGSASVELSGSTITAQATGYAEAGTCGPTDKATTVTVKITNNSAGSMNIAFSKDNSVTCNEPSPIALTAGGSFTFTVTSGKGASSTETGVMTISSITLAAANYTTTFATAANGSYTVTYGGAARTVGQSYTEMSDTPYILSATPANGYKFIAWVNGSGATIGTTQTNFSYTAASDATIKPVFYKTDTAMYYIKGNPSVQYGYLDEAITAAGSSGTIVVAANGTVYGSSSQTNFTIPSGVTLLVPMDSAGTVVTDSYHAQSTVYTKDERSEYRRLTVPQGTTLTVNGKVSVASKVYNQGIGQAGPYGLIQLESGSNLTFNSGSILYAFGYIKGAGTITVNSGATVYESVSVTDYPGSASNVNSLKNAGVFPFWKFTIKNIESQMTVKSGATETGLINFYGTSAGYHFKYVTVIGTGGIFESDSDVVKSFSGSKLNVTVHGNSKLSGISVSILGYTLNTSNLSGIPIPNGFNITIADGTTTLNENVILTKGSAVTVNYGATVKIPSGKNLYVLDSTDDKSTNGGTVDAMLDINGTVEATGGFYTSTSGADIKSSQKTGKVIFKSAPGNTSTVKVRTSETDATAVNLTPAQLHNGDGTYTATADATANTTYYYCTQCNPSGVWETAHTTYTVTWKNADGTVLETDENVAYGTTPTYDGETPTKSSGNERIAYVFTGWTPAIVPVTGDATYTAQFNTVYTLNFAYQTQMNGVDSEVKTATIKYTYGGSIQVPSIRYYNLTSWTLTVGSTTKTYTGDTKETELSAAIKDYIDGNTAASDITVKAFFKRQTYTMEVYSDINGKRVERTRFDCNVGRSAWVNAQETLTEDGDYKFDHWKIGPSTLTDEEFNSLAQISDIRTTYFNGDTGGITVYAVAYYTEEGGGQQVTAPKVTVRDYFTENRGDTYVVGMTLEVLAPTSYTSFTIDEVGFGYTNSDNNAQAGNFSERTSGNWGADWKSGTYTLRFTMPSADTTLYSYGFAEYTLNGTRYRIYTAKDYQSDPVSTTTKTGAYDVIIRSGWSEKRTRS